MDKQGAKPNKIILSSALKACSMTRAVAEGKYLHDQVVKYELDSNIVISNTLVTMYAMCGCIEEASSVFERLQERDEVSWGAIITGYVRYGHGWQALKLYTSMLKGGVEPNEVICSSILKACGSIGALQLGRLMHDMLVKFALQSDSTVGNALVDLYAKCGSLIEARFVFNNLQCRDIISWGSIISGYADYGHGFFALELYEMMELGGTKPNRVIFLCVLKACGNIGAIAQGRMIHNQVVITGLESQITIGNALIDMYAKCGSVHEAYVVFNMLVVQDEVSWGTLITGCSTWNRNCIALDLLKEMQQKNILPNQVTFLGVVKACGNTENLVRGRHIHVQILKAELDHDVTLENALVEMYLKCNCLEDALNVLLRLQAHDVELWVGIIAGYAIDGIKALEIFGKMQQAGFVPSTGIFLCLLRLCCTIRALEQGSIIHEQILRSGLESEASIGNSLVDMYVKCHRIEDAHKVFKSLQSPNEISWGAMIAGYAGEADFVAVERSLGNMLQCGINPDLPIFTSILAACSNCGLLREGISYFKRMVQQYGILPTVHHYSCMIDLFARGGLLREAEDMLHTMHLPPDMIVWKSLLNSCSMYGSVKIGKQCFDHLVVYNPCHALGYALIVDAYADADMWGDI